MVKFIVECSSNCPEFSDEDLISELEEIFHIGHSHLDRSMYDVPCLDLISIVLSTKPRKGGETK